MSWSLSSLQTYEQCGFKWKLRYVEKFPEAKSFAAARGTDNHALIENYLKGGVGQGQLPAELSFYTNFLDHLKGQEIYPEHKISLNEKWETVAWEDKPWYKGVLDLKLLKRGVSGDRPGDQPVVAELSEAIVYDWKTGKIYPSHDDQKSIYAVATFSEHPSLYTVRSVHVYLDLGSNRERTFYRDEVHQLRKYWESRVAPIGSSLIPNPGWHCRYCGFSKFKGGPCQF